MADDIERVLSKHRVAFSRVAKKMENRKTLRRETQRLSNEIKEDRSALYGAVTELREAGVPVSQISAMTGYSPAQISTLGR